MERQVEDLDHTDALVRVVRAVLAAGIAGFGVVAGGLVVVVAVPLGRHHVLGVVCVSVRVADVACAADWLEARHQWTGNRLSVPRDEVASIALRLTASVGTPSS